MARFAPPRHNFNRYTKNLEIPHMKLPTLTPTKVTLVLFLVSFVIISTLYFSQHNFNQNNEKENNITWSRTFEKDSIRLVSSFRVNDRIMMREVKGDKIYVVHGWTEIQVIDTSGKMIMSTGKQGRGPGEFQQIWDISVSHNDEIYASDGINHTISHFSNKGHLLQSFVISSYFHSLTKLTPSGVHYILKTSSSEQSKRNFSLYNIQTGKNIEMQTLRLVPSKSKDNMVIEAEDNGSFYSNSNDRVFYILHGAGQFSAFDSAGKHLYNCFTIDKTAYSEYVSKSVEGVGTIVTDGENSRFVNVFADADKDHLYILSNAKSPNIKETKQRNHEAIIDIYNSTDGSYKSSLKLPKYVLDGTTIWNINIAVYDKYLYVAAAELGIVYRFMLPSSLFHS